MNFVKVIKRLIKNTKLDSLTACVFVIILPFNVVKHFYFDTNLVLRHNLKPYAYLLYVYVMCTFRKP